MSTFWREDSRNCSATRTRNRAFQVRPTTDERTWARRLRPFVANTPRRVTTVPRASRFADASRLLSTISLHKDSLARKCKSCNRRNSLTLWLRNIVIASATSVSIGTAIVTMIIRFVSSSYLRCSFVFFVYIVKSCLLVSTRTCDRCLNHQLEKRSWCYDRESFIGSYQTKLQDE